MSRKYDTEGLLGMHEMEMALESLLDRANVLGCSLTRLAIYPNEYQSQLSGLCHMMCNGWIESSYPNGTFKITQGLVKRMRTRECWKDLPDVPTVSELVGDRLKNWVSVEKKAHE